jgi:hypothetical protein
MPATDAHEIIRRAVRSGVIVGRDDGSIEVRDIGIASWQPYLLAAGVTDEVVGIIGKPGKLWLPSVTVEPKNPAVINAIVQEVARKNIEDRWNGDGGPMSVVGLPVTDRIELARTENGFRADFRSGTIHTLDTGGIEVVPGDWVRVSWVGLECVMRQEETDEVYGSVFAHGPGRAAAPKVVAFPGGNETYKMGPPGARIILTNELLYEGPLVNLNIGAVLVENDSGDVEEISAEITAKIAQAGAAVIGAMTGVAADAVTSQTWYMAGIGAVVGLVLDDVFGIGDDPYPPTAQPITWQELAEWRPALSYTRPGDPKTINAYNITRDVSGIDDAGDQGWYRFYYLSEHMNPPG